MASKKAPKSAPKVGRKAGEGRSNRAAREKEASKRISRVVKSGARTSKGKLTIKSQERLARAARLSSGGKTRADGSGG